VNTPMSLRRKMIERGPGVLLRRRRGVRYRRSFGIVAVILGMIVLIIASDPNSTGRERGPMSDRELTRARMPR